MVVVGLILDIDIDIDIDIGTLALSAAHAPLFLKAMPKKVKDEINDAKAKVNDLDGAKLAKKGKGDVLLKQIRKRYGRLLSIVLKDAKDEFKKDKTLANMATWLILRTEFLRLRTIVTLFPSR